MLGSGRCVKNKKNKLKAAQQNELSAKFDSLNVKNSEFVYAHVQLSQALFLKLTVTIGRSFEYLAMEDETRSHALLIAGEIASVLTKMRSNNKWSLSGRYVRRDPFKEISSSQLSPPACPTICRIQKWKIP